MRLWHEKLIHLLPKNQLLGQHRECCALRAMDGKRNIKLWTMCFHIPHIIFLFTMYWL